MVFPGYQMIDIKNYNPGRFTYLMEQPFVHDLWHFLTDENRIRLMVSATEFNKLAIEPFLAELESQFEKQLSNPDYPKEEISVFANNMIKQVLERNGYEYVACGRCEGRFIKSSGLYRKQT
jgi:hypothetical protein